MTTRICKTCQTTFEGRPNRRYCSVHCRRAAEMEERGRKGGEMVRMWFGLSKTEFEALSPKNLWPELFNGNLKNA